MTWQTIIAGIVVLAALAYVLHRSILTFRAAAKGRATACGACPKNKPSSVVSLPQTISLSKIKRSEVDSKVTESFTATKQ